MDFKVIQQALPEIVTQLLGFLIVFFILKRYAFGPILGIIDARREHVEKELAQLEHKKKDIERVEAEYRQRLTGIEQEARVKIQEAANTGLALAKDIQEKARADSQKMIERAQFEIQQDLAKARLGLRDQIVDLSGLMTEKIIKSKLDEREHRRLVDEFVKDMEKLN